MVFHETSFLILLMRLHPLPCQFLSLGDLVGRHVLLSNSPVTTGILITIDSRKMEPHVGFNNILRYSPVL